MPQPAGVARLVAGVLLVCATLSAGAGTTQSFTLGAGGYAASRERQYKVYVPDGLTAPAPMVMALHGCRQTHDDVLRDWGLTAASDRYGFILVAPFITSYDGLRNTNCWGFWLDQHRHEGRGEAEDLHRIAVDVEARFAVDPQRRYITGLSSGGAMAVVASVTHNEYWAAAAGAAGLPYGEDAASVSLSGQCPGSASFHAVTRVASDMRAELDDAYAIPLMVLQNNGDCTVVQPAGRNLRDAALAVFGDAAHDTPAEAQAGDTACTPAFQTDYGCRHVRYTADGSATARSIVETVFFNGPAATPSSGDTDHGHYWIGGEAGGNGLWSVRRGPSYPDIVWDFFARHGRGVGAPPGHPRIVLNGADPLRLRVGDSFVDPGASAIDAEDGALPVSADCSGVDTGRAGEYRCEYRAEDSDGNVATAFRRVQVGEVAPPPSCAGVAAAPGAHIGAGRAVYGGWFGLRALASGDRRDIGYAFDYWFPVTLYEGEAGRWYAAPPAGCSPP